MTSGMGACLTLFSPKIAGQGGGGGGGGGSGGGGGHAAADVGGQIDSLHRQRRQGLVEVSGICYLQRESSTAAAGGVEPDATTTTHARATTTTTTRRRSCRQHATGGHAPLDGVNDGKATWKKGGRGGLSSGDRTLVAAAFREDKTLMVNSAESVRSAATSGSSSPSEESEHTESSSSRGRRRRQRRPQTAAAAGSGGGCSGDGCKPLRYEAVLKELTSSTTDDGPSDRSARGRETKRPLSEEGDCNAQLASLLQGAVRQGDATQVTRLLQCGARVNCRDPATRRTPLFQAAERGYVSVGRLLLEHGARVNVHDKWRHTPLQQAVAWKQLRMVALLLQHRARATEGTLLQDVISMEPDEEIVLKLIERGADVNATDMTGQTPMHMAVKFGAANIAGILLDAGADVNKVSRGMVDVDNSAAVLHHVRRQLAPPLGLEHLLQDGWSPLRMAQKYKRFDLVVWLVNAGANIVLCDSNGRLPHHKAVTQRNCPSLHHILAHRNCPIDVRDVDGNTAIKLNFEAHAMSMVGANPDCGCCSNQGDDATTAAAATAASLEEYANTTVLLLQHGADITDLYIHGYDLLYHLCSSKFSYDLRLLQAVLNSGNDLREQLASSGQACLNALERQGRLDMYEWLHYFVNTPRTLHDQCRHFLRAHLRRMRPGRSIWTAVTALPLPNALVDAVLLQSLQGATLTRHFAKERSLPVPPPTSIRLGEAHTRRKKTSSRC